MDENRGKKREGNVYMNYVAEHQTISIYLAISLFIIYSKMLNAVLTLLCFCFVMTVETACESR